MSSQGLVFLTDAERENPPSPYPAEAVPPTGDTENSRFAGLNTSPSGVAIGGAANVALVYNHKLNERIDETPELDPPTVTLRLPRLVKNGREISATEGKEVTVRRTHQHDPKRGKIGNPRMSGGALADALIFGEVDGLPDLMVVAAFVELARQTRADGDVLRRHTINMQTLLLLRAGAPRAFDGRLPQ